MGAKDMGTLYIIFIDRGTFMKEWFGACSPLFEADNIIIYTFLKVFDKSIGILSID